MGKIKRQRQKYHAAAAKPVVPLPVTKPAEVPQPVCPQPPTSPIVLGPGPFSGVEISPEALKQQLPDLDKISVVSSKVGRLRSKDIGSDGKQLTKKLKRKMRHENFLKKIDAIEQAKKSEVARKKQARREAKARKRRQKTPVVGDMRKLADALPSLEQLLKQSQEQLKKGKEVKPRHNIARTKAQKHKKMLKEISIFKKVLAHPMYKSDPFRTMSTHVENKILSETVDQEG